VLVPKGSLPFRLLSPQHFAQENYAQRIDKQPRGTLSLTSGMDHILSWADQRFTITAPLTTSSNIALISSSTGYSKFASFVSLVDAPDEPMALFGHHLIPDDDDYDLAATEDTTSSVDGNISTHEGEHEGGLESGTPTSATNNQSSIQLPTDQPHVVSFLPSDNCMPIVEEAEDNEEKLDNPQHELLLYHYRLGHESFTNLQSMAKAGILPTRLANCRIPQCAACHYGKASKVPWRVKGDPKDGKLFEATVAGQVVSVDQLQSTVPGLVGQMKGWPTTQRYQYATIFVDHYSRLSFVYIQKTDNAAETLMAKHSFEGYARTMGVKVQHYHANNRRFCENIYMKDVQAQGQTISFCGVNAHFQSGIAERRIRELQDGA
jgi:hypothetical protein